MLLLWIACTSGFVSLRRSPAAAAGHLVRSNVPDWDAIQPEEKAKAKRAKSIQQTMAQLREYKKQGRRYDGVRAENQSFGEAGYSELMNEAEAFFKTTTTTGVGGTWTPTTGEPEYEPKVSTWGRFPRPRDMSAAYGGGKRIGVGVEVNKTLEAERAATTKAKLEAFRAKSGKDQKLVDANREKIERAIEVAKRAVRRGVSWEGVEALRAVEDACTPRTELGAAALLELALCCEAVGDSDGAKRLYAQLATSPISEVKRRALQLNFGFEAQSKLGVGSYAGSEASKMALAAYEFDFSQARKESKVYVQSVDTRLSTTSKLEGDVRLETSTAFDLLRRASIGGQDFASPDRVAKALELFEDELSSSEEEEEEEGYEIEDLLEGLNSKYEEEEEEEEEEQQQQQQQRTITTGLERLDGNWTVVFSSRRDDPAAAKYLPRGASIQVDASARTVNRRLPALGGLLFVDWRGKASPLPASRSIVASRDLVSPAIFGAFSGDRWQADILHLDDRLCALRSDGKDLFLCKRAPRYV